MLDRIQEPLVAAGEAGEHFRILPVALAVVGVDRPELARVGYENAVAERFQEAADPRAVHAHLDDNQCAGMLRAEFGEGLAGVGDGLLGDDPALCVKDADSVLAVPEVDFDGSGR